MYYVYELQYPATKIPFYVGKGICRRALYHTMRNKKGYWTDNRYKDNVIRQILDTGCDPLIEYVFFTEDENIAYNKEEELIKKYGRRLFEECGILTNICDSSRPPHGIYSEERRELYRQRMIGNTISKGRTQSDIEKEKRSESLIEAYKSGRRVVTDRMREATRKTHTGKIVSSETRAKQSIIARNRPPRTRESIEKGLLTKKIKGVSFVTNKKSITIDGVVYDTIKSAAIKFGISEYKVKKLSDDYHKKV